MTTEYETDENGIITSPGKFEAEMAYVPYFWEASLNGSADTLDWPDGACTWIVEIDADDRSKFPQLPADAVYAHLEESGQGFVSCELLTQAEYAELMERYESENEESEEE